LRSLRRSPGFVAIATLSLGAALALSTSMAAIIDAMTHPESPFRDAGQLYGVRIFVDSKISPSAKEILDAIAGLKGVESLATSRWEWRPVITGDRPFDRTGIEYVRPGYFELFGVKPRLGRLPSASQQTEEKTAVVSDRLWRSRFENRTVIRDAIVSIGDHPYTVVGVLPAGTDRSTWTDVWIPDSRPDSGGLARTLIRLRAGVTDTTMWPRIAALARHYTRTFAGPRERGFRFALYSLRPNPLEIRDIHRAMVGAAIFVLLIGCANVAALMLARGIARRRDYALRLALGAGRIEIAREVIAEVLVLAIAGTVAGALMTTWIVSIITRATPEDLMWLGVPQPQWTWRVLGLSALAVFATVAVAGGFPAWRASRTDPAGPLKEGSGGTTGRPGTRFRWLVMAELALSMTLLVATSLMVKSALKMARYDFGYDAHNIWQAGATFWHDDSLSLADRQRFMDASLASVRAVPGVRGATMMFGLCSGDRGTVTTDLTIQGGPAGNYFDPFSRGGCDVVGPGFFGTIGMAVLDGRDFLEGDGESGGAVILDQKTARLLFPHERAVGHMLKLGILASTQPWYRIVGVVRDHVLQFQSFPELGVDSVVRIYVTLPRTQQGAGTIIVHADPRAKNVPLALARTVSASLPSRVSSSVSYWLEYYDRNLHGAELLALLFTMLGVGSLILGAAGLFSVVSYITGLRMREFAVRIALGATRGNVLRLVLREGLVMALGGTGVGAMLGMWTGFLVWSRLWGVYPVDAAALVGAEVTLLLVTMLACVGPALRATRADPLEVMRAT
jgi:predicted permease